MKYVNCVLVIPISTKKGTTITLHYANMNQYILAEYNLSQFFPHFFAIILNGHRIYNSKWHALYLSHLNTLVYR